MTHEEAVSKFRETKELFRRLSYEIMIVVESYYIWRTLVFSRSTIEAGEEQANKNVEVINLYKEFLLPTEYSHLSIFTIGLMKFFDKDPRALSFNNVVQEIKKYESAFTADVMRAVQPQFNEMRVIKDNYAPITQETIDFIENTKLKHSVVIPKLNDLRNKRFAHTDLAQIEENFIPIEVEALINSVKDIFNRLTYDFESSSTIFEHVEGDAVRSTKFVFENLERGEIQRKIEIKKQWGEEIGHN